MSQLWSVVRRHPLATLLIALFVLIAIVDGSGAGIGTAAFIIVVIVAVAFVFDRFKRRHQGRAHDQNGRFIAQTDAKLVRKGRQAAPQIVPPAQSVVDPYREQIDRQATQLPQQATQMSPQQMAAKTDSEQLSPTGQSAFLETAQRPIPVAPRRESSLITINHLLAMTPTEFEEFCVKALQGIGYTEVRRVGGAGDLTADIFGVDNMGRSTVVQCKRYKPGTKVGSPALQMFIGMKSVHHQAERGIYMTTADYSVPAVRLAKQHDIVLIDGDDMVKIAGLAMMPKSTPQVAAGIARYCASCGAEFTTDARFCTSCGAPRAA